jgi:transposase InsO family protein
MRYAAAEKLEIIRLVEQSSLPVRRTLDQLGIPRSTFYCWYDRYRTGQAEGLQDRPPAPRRVWNKLPAAVTQKVLELALKEPQLSPRELAVSFVDRQQYFVSEASVYRLLKAHDLITSPAFILLKAADHFAQPTTAPNQLWQTDFTYLRVIGWGWFYLSTVLDDFSRYILAWKLCTTMTATDVSDTLALALRISGLERVRVRHRPRLLSDNGPSYVSAQLGSWLAEHGMTHTRGKPYHPMTQGKIGRLPPLDEEPDPARELLPARSTRSAPGRVTPCLLQRFISCLSPLDIPARAKHLLKTRVLCFEFPDPLPQLRLRRGNSGASG